MTEYIEFIRIDRRLAALERAVAQLQSASDDPDASDTEADEDNV